MLVVVHKYQHLDDLERNRFHEAFPMRNLWSIACGRKAPFHGDYSKSAWLPGVFVNTGVDGLTTVNAGVICEECTVVFGDQLVINCLKALAPLASQSVYTRNCQSSRV